MSEVNFSLPDQNGRIHNLADYRGQWVVLYIYPADDTPGCTTEACSFRDNIPEFEKLGVPVLGLSKDSPISHAKFIKKYGLNFTLLSDKDLAVIKSFNAFGPKKLFGREYDGVIRTTFIFNPQGEIAKRYDGVTPEGHVEHVKKDLVELMA